ncbi:MAG TPA: Rpn family recombination-promoting nuclease/putative transposase, partial [Rhodocyclaceae bacterium]|nr:Rpn family recombination-promoting nuclease/putative transposase [Rhodocyclaceae bacterium]
MKHRIDPKIDCVFKALLGSLENSNLLENFLNAILSGELRAPIDHVDILNPYNEKKFLDDKLSIVDVKASDGDGRIFQIEIQMVSYRHLLSRILYTWTDIYSQQLQSGAEYHKLQPTYSIWLLAEDSIPEDDDYLHAFKMRDAKGRALSDHGGIWLLELDKFGS